MKTNLFSLLISTLIILSINSNFLELEPLLKANGGKYSLDDILDGARRVKTYVLNNKALPKIVGVLSSEESMASFTYAMGIAILNINDNKKSEKIQTINLEAPSTPYKCELRVYKADYIDAINRVVRYCKEHGAAPAYVLSSSINIGYIEYSFGFSKILDFYRTNGQLPNYNEFSSKQIYGSEGGDEGGESGPISGVTFKAGINERNNKKSYKEYTRTGGTCESSPNIKSKAAALIAGKSKTLDKARALFNFVRSNIIYEYYYDSRYKASGTLSRGKGNCCDQANLLVSLCRVSGIPAKYAQGQGCRFSSGTYGHVWAQILVDDIWYAADPTSNRNSLGFINNWDIHNFHSLRQYAFLDF